MSAQIPPKAAAATIIGFVVVMIVLVCQEVRDELADHSELPKEVQERFHYDAAKGNAYSVEQNTKLEALRKQQEEAMRQRQAATAISASRPAVTPDPIKPTATFGIESLRPRKAPPVTEQLHRIGAICRDAYLRAVKRVYGTATAAPVHNPATVTITKPISIAVQHGSVGVDAGTKLPFVSRAGDKVRVRYYDGADYDIPISATDLK